MKRSWKLALVVIVLGTMTGIAQAGTISLQWDSVAMADGYRIYYSTSSGQYNPQNYHQVGRVTQTTIPSLQDCTMYYLAVKAFNSLGESDTFSEEISGWARPTLAATVNTVRQGAQVEVEISGTNFMNGLDVEVDNPNVYVDSVTASACNTLVVGLTVEPLSAGVRAAETGSFALSVINPDQVYGTRDGSIQVALDSARFNLNQSDSTTESRVDGKDLVWLARVFGVNEGNALYDPDYDMDGDGSIDGTDLSYIASNMGGCWDGENWTSSGTGWDIQACPMELR